jgi:hypothetical protein
MHPLTFGMPIFNDKESKQMDKFTLIQLRAAAKLLQMDLFYPHLVGAVKRSLQFSDFMPRL